MGDSDSWLLDFEQTARDDISAEDAARTAHAATEERRMTAGRGDLAGLMQTNSVLLVDFVGKVEGTDGEEASFRAVDRAGACFLSASGELRGCPVAEARERD